MPRRNIRAQRARLGLTQASVSRRMNQLGFNWYPQTVGLVERNQRPLLADELLALALALETTPAVLYEPPPDLSVVMFDGERIPAQRLKIIDDSVNWVGDELKVSTPTVQYRPVEQVIAVHEMREELRRPRPAVVAAIVTSPLGVLVGHRRDGSPPWTFIAGEQEPGEQPEDTAVREVKEETSLEIEAGEIIGERDHPRTGRHMVYMSGRPARGTKVIIGDEAELDQVRWVTLAEADELMAGQIYEPVRKHLVRELRQAQPPGDDEG
jgi:8-oxo-dGTP pyrophosphatase MutT (NUDIX family)